MSRELSTYEAMGGTYTEVDGVLYPNIKVSEEADVWVGKYGLLWMNYMKSNHAERYRHHIRMGTLNTKALEVNEEAYEMLEGIVNQYLVKHKPQNSASTMEMWRLREQAKQMARVCWDEYTEKCSRYMKSMENPRQTAENSPCEQMEAL